jgi:hypothetical protein
MQKEYCNLKNKGFFELLILKNSILQNLIVSSDSVQ